MSEKRNILKHTYREMDVNPKQARKWLKNVHTNRKHRRSPLYTYLMKNKMWRFLPAPLIFCKDGKLLDGGNRLQSLIDSNTTQRFLIAGGFDEDIFWDLDTGKSRSGSDTLESMGLSNTNKVFAALNLLNWYRHEEKKYSGRRNGYTNKRVQEHIVEEPEIIEHVRFCAVSPKIPQIIPASLGGFIYHIFSEIDKKKAKDFITKLMYGTELSRDDTLYMLRTKFEKNNRDFKRGKGKFQTACRIAMIIKAWNFVWNNIKISSKDLDWRPESEPTEAMPKVLGIKEMSRKKK